MEQDTFQEKIKEYHNWNFALNVASGGFLADKFSYHTVFTVSLLAALFSWLVLIFKVRKQNPSQNIPHYVRENSK